MVMGSSSAGAVPQHQHQRPLQDGAVLKLHFCCRAELPMGSSLRVTGSTLWAPSSAAEGDQVSGDPQQQQQQHHMHEHQHAPASSVEMVTDPDRYPLWYTRRPVIVVASTSASTSNTFHTTSATQQQVHHYRYMVVSPGEAMPTAEGAPHTRWEDPFSNAATSAVASPSQQNQNQANNQSLLHLPYRTLHLPRMQHSDPHNDIQVDHWNSPADATWAPYLQAEDLRHQRELALSSSGSTDRHMTDPDMNMHTTDDVDPMDEQDQSNDKDSDSRLFLVCYHLPVFLSRTGDGGWTASWSESLISKTEASGISKTKQTTWIGTVSAVPPITTDHEKDAVRQLLDPMSCVPLFLDPEMDRGHYLGMCKQVLWPAFHNVDLLDLCTSGWGARSKHSTMDPNISTNTTIPTQHQQHTNHSNEPDVKSDWDQNTLDGWWHSYVSVNSIFANVIKTRLQPKDTVWVHDYHLALLPKMLSMRSSSITSLTEHDDVALAQSTGIRMVFFLHIPFPTSQVFRELQHGEAILEGMLHADVVGFHAFDHARHFLNASKRILGLTYESLMGGLIGVRFHGKKVLVTMSNVSIETDMVDVAMALPEVQAGAKALKEKHGRAIIAGIDVAQGLSGIQLKLLAFERLLMDYPNWRNNVVMVQKCLVPNTRLADEGDTLREIRASVHRIQEKFGTEVMDYEEIQGSSSLPMVKRLVIWMAANVLLHTPIREGLNLLPLEYVYVQPVGVTIASEFSAVCSILNGALRVNPYDIPNCSITIDKALSMELQEREGRRARDIDFVSSCPSGLWSQNVLRDLNDAMLGTNLNDGDYDDGTSHSKTVAAQKMKAVNTVESMFSRENELGITPLELESVISAYNVTNKRVIILDFNGTLLTKEPAGKYLKREILGTSGDKPSLAVKQALTQICADPRNSVYVVSGDSQENLEDAMGDIPGLGLAASNGACFAHPVGFDSSSRKWETFDYGVDWKAVKKVALPVLSKYTARTNGSFVKLTHSSIGWSYYSCDPEWGSLQAAYLVPELEHELRSFDVRFVTLKGIVEVVPRKLNKGFFVKKVLEESKLRTGTPGSADFILCMGDDVSDEKMFTSVFSFIAEQDQMDKSMYAFTVAVGKKPSHAARFVDGAKDVSNVLISIAHGDVSLVGRSASYSEDEDMQIDALMFD